MKYPRRIQSEILNFIRVRWQGLRQDVISCHSVLKLVNFASFLLPLSVAILRYNVVSLCVKHNRSVISGKRLKTQRDGEKF